MEGMLTPPAAVEALLFASGGPLEKKRLASLLGITEKELEAALAALAESLSGRGIALVEADADVELRAAPGAAALVKKFREAELARDLGKAGIETLAVIAYRSGATRSDIDWVRGVNSSASLRTLLLRGLVEGREDERDRRRIRYRLTAEALAHLGLARTDELPRYGELAAGTAAALESEEAGETA